MTRTTLTFWVSFFIFYLLSCQKEDRTTSLSIISKDGKAIGLSIKGNRLSEKDITNRLKIQLITAGERASVLGEFKIDGDEVIFEPLVPFTEGLKYSIILGDSVIGELTIPSGKYSSPKLLSIYPEQDTLPENLLKLYLEFSQPMVEGRSLEQITLVGSKGDTLKGTFLDLQPELWNSESTVLTLWFDPGRIKRDLIPNRDLGAPLTFNQTYTLHVSASWQSKEGMSLSDGYQKTFVAEARDITPPNLQTWDISTPTANTRDAVVVTSPESLDYFLFKESLSIVVSDGSSVSGIAEVSNNARVYRFLPENLWAKGVYTLVVEARLEDLAGNNLNRPFDRDVEKGAKQKEQKTFTKDFEIR